MNTYEVLVIFKPIVDVENVDATLNHFKKNIVEAQQGEILESDRIGRKRLAYEIKKFKDGFLSLFLLKLPAEKIADFKRACQLNDDILRMTMMRQDNLQIFAERRTSREEGPARRDEGGGRREFAGRRGGYQDRS